MSRLAVNKLKYDAKGIQSRLNQLGNAKLSKAFEPFVEALDNELKSEKTKKEEPKAKAETKKAPAKAKEEKEEK